MEEGRTVATVTAGTVLDAVADWVRACVVLGPSPDDDALRQVTASSRRRAELQLAALIRRIVREEGRGTK